MENIFETVVKDNKLHAKWLNTLSMMENAGAKKIKKCEHPILATEMILKHAAEEARQLAIGALPGFSGAQSGLPELLQPRAQRTAGGRTESALRSAAAPDAAHSRTAEGGAARGAGLR